MAEMDSRTMHMIATGVAGFAISMELLTTLNNRGVISDDTLLSIMDGALLGVEGVDADAGHEIFRMARELLGTHLTDFRKQSERGL